VVLRKNQIVMRKGGGSKDERGKRKKRGSILLNSGCTADRRNCGCFVKDSQRGD